jgi:hypothetical protein
MCSKAHGVGTSRELGSANWAPLETKLREAGFPRRPAGGFEPRDFAQEFRG